MSPNMSAIVVGVIQLVGSYVATNLVDRAGRKVRFIFKCLFEYVVEFLFFFFSQVLICCVVDWNSSRFAHFRSTHNVQGLGLWCRSIQLDSSGFVLFRYFHCVVGGFDVAIFGHLRNFATEFEKLWRLIVHDTCLGIGVFRYQIFTTFNRHSWIPWQLVPVRWILFIGRHFHFDIHARNERQKLRTNHGLASMKTHYLNSFHEYKFRQKRHLCIITAFVVLRKLH